MSTTEGFKCRLCGTRGHGGWLERVNPKGVVPAIWECRPQCGAALSQAAALLGAIEGADEPKTAED